MIDPKLNELPVSKTTGKPSAPSTETPERSKTPREGLSINDTVAGDTLLSTGVPGVDTSGVRAGAGAAAGSSSLTAGESASAAPNIVPGARETGTTVAGSNPTGTSPTGHFHPTSGPTTGGADTAVGTEMELTDADSDLTYDEVAARAHECWIQRGCPAGSPEVDWQLAKEQIRAERRRETRGASATS